MGSAILRRVGLCEVLRGLLDYDRNGLIQRKQEPDEVVLESMSILVARGRVRHEESSTQVEEE